MTYGYKKYEWSAFTEADLLQGTNGNSIGRGDSFTMPGAATVHMSTWDNDRSLSGDRREKATDHSGQKATIDGVSLGTQIYAEKYHVLKGSDGKKYYLIEIELEHGNAPGKGDDYFTFYGDVPPAGVELTVKASCNVKGSWVDYKCLGAGSSAPANTPPEFTNVPADGIICVDENTSLVIDLNASDADGDTLGYRIVGGRDAAFFEVDAQTGELTFKTPPDYENPQSGGGNNTYDVKVEVSDGNGGTEVKAMWVKVKDVAEDTGGNCVVIEAETMHLNGYRIETRDDASGGAGIKLSSAVGYASTTFAGAAGSYDLSLSYIDESDGQGFIDVFVNGVFHHCISLDQDNGGNGVDGQSSWSTIVIQDLALSSGDTVTFKGRGNCSEFARIDKIELCQDGQPCPQGYAVLDFEGLATGAVVSTQFAGVTISAQRDVNNTPANDAMIFDSNNPTGGDHDLAYTGRGNILIVSEDNDSSDPDDAVGGTIHFDFDNPSDLHDIVLLDIEESGGTIVLTFEDGSTRTLSIPAAGNNSAQTVALDAAGVTSMQINLAGSGAVDDLCWKPGDPPAQTAAIGDKVFIDANGNGQQDTGEAGLAGVAVDLLDAGGTVLSSTVTDAQGMYLFDGLAAGDYAIAFTQPDGFDFTGMDQGGDDARDSDADQGTGRTGVYTLAEGETNLTVDAGVVSHDPNAMDDAATTCADQPVAVDVLNNDSDSPGDVLTITHVAGMAISDGMTVDVGGVGVTLTGGQLVFDGAAAHLALNVGEEATQSFAYTVSDGMGGSATANVDVTFCGVAETLDDMFASLPASGMYQIADEAVAAPVGPSAYDMRISGTGDARLDGVTFAQAYCLSLLDPADTADSFATAPVLAGDITDGKDGSVFGASQTGFANGLAAADNLDLVNWILAQDYENDASGQFTGWEVQRAIWELTDQYDTDYLSAIDPAYGDNADVDFIVSQALANGEGFMAGPGGIASFIVDPNPSTPTNSQPFIVAFQFDDFDCLC
jgi:hypothetical protein